jgi:hypothetical protein
MDQRSDHGDRCRRIDCAWCKRWYPNIVEFLSHVEETHLSDSNLNTAA